MGYLSNTLFIKVKPLVRNPAGSRLAFPTYLRAKIRGHQLMENGLVGEIRTRMIVVAVRCITFLPPRDVQHAAWPSSCI
jgi:hypothetical protein